MSILNNHHLDEIETHGYNDSRPNQWRAILPPNELREVSTMHQTHYPGIPYLNPSHDMLAENVASTTKIRALTSGTKESLRLTNLRKEADEDQEYQQLKNYIQKGFPSYRS